MDDFKQISMKMKKRYFTLIELIIVIAIFAIPLILFVVFVFIYPAVSYDSYYGDNPPTEQVEGSIP